MRKIPCTKLIIVFQIASSPLKMKVITLATILMTVPTPSSTRPNSWNSGTSPCSVPIATMNVTATSFSVGARLSKILTTCLKSGARSC